MCTRDHGATRFSLQIGPTEPPRMRREASGVSFLMCPFCVRALLSTEATRQRFRPRRTQLRRGDAQQRTYGVDATEHDDELLPVRRAVRSAARRVGRGWQRVLHMVSVLGAYAALVEDCERVDDEAAVVKSRSAGFAVEVASG